jgi:hypothetical protein
LIPSMFREQAFVQPFAVHGSQVEQHHALPVAENAEEIRLCELTSTNAPSNQVFPPDGCWPVTLWLH